MGRVDLEVYGLPIDALVVSCYPRRLVLDFASNLAEVIELASCNVKELCPFLLLACYARGRVWDVDFIVLGLVVAVARDVDQLENKRSPCHDTTSSREEISANDILEYRRLSCRL
jgi:hypothetical protein